MSESIALIPLNQRVAKFHDLLTQNYRQRITPAIKDTIKNTLSEINVTSVNLDDTFENWSTAAANALGEYMKVNNIPAESFY